MVNCSCQSCEMTRYLSSSLNTQTTLLHLRQQVLHRPFLTFRTDIIRRCEILVRFSCAVRNDTRNVWLMVGLGCAVRNDTRNLGLMVGLGCAVRNNTRNLGLMVGLGCAVRNDTRNLGLMVGLSCVVRNDATSGS